MEHFALGVLFRVLRVRLEHDMSAVEVDTPQPVMQEALNVLQALERGLEMVGDRVDPVLSVRVRLDLLPVLVKLKRNVELEALRRPESRLHHSIS